MISITMTILLFCHFCSCLWIFLHSFYHQEKLSWISIVDYNNKLELYIQSFYLVIQTVSTVGYGDNTPSNDTEIILSIIVMTIGAILFSYFIVSTINYKLNLDQYCDKKLQYKKIIMEVFCDSSNVSKNLKERIIEALEYNHKKVIINAKEQSEFLNEMSQEMKIKIIKNIKQKNSKQIFFKNKNDLFVFDTIQLLKPLQVKQKQPIFQQNQYPNNIYLIQQGCVLLMTENFLCFKEYIQNSYFGDVEILKNIQLKEKGCKNYHLTQYKAIAKFDCDLFTISEFEFLKLIQLYPYYLPSFKLIAKQKQQYIEHSLKKIQIYKFLRPNSNFWNLQYNVEMLKQSNNYDQQQINKRKIKKSKNKKLAKQSNTLYLIQHKKQTQSKSVYYIPKNEIKEKNRSKSQTLIKSKINQTQILIPQIHQTIKKMKDFQTQITKKIFQIQLQQNFQKKSFQELKHQEKTEKVLNKMHSLNYFHYNETQSSDSDSDSNDSLNKINIRIKKENLAYQIIKQNNEKFNQLYDKLQKYQNLVDKFEKTKKILEVNLEKIAKNN